MNFLHFLQVMRYFLQMVLLQLDESNLVENSSLVHVVLHASEGTNGFGFHAVLHCFLKVRKGVVKTTEYGKTSSIATAIYSMQLPCQFQIF